MASRSVHRVVEPDVLVLGQHPSAYLAAALLCARPSPFHVMHATIPGETWDERLCLLNPTLFSLHPLLRPLKRDTGGVAVAGARFLAEDPRIASEYRSKGTLARVVWLTEVRQAMAKVARSQGVRFAHPESVTFIGLDEKGAEVAVGNRRVHPRAVVLCGRLSASQEKLLGLPESWDRDVMRRYTWCIVRDKSHPRASTRAAHSRKPVIPMSLDLRGMMGWGWMLPGEGAVQLAVSQPAHSVPAHPPVELLKHWLKILLSHGCMAELPAIAPESVRVMDMPAAGALMHEGVANRTLLVGPAGGFFSACGEDLYPNCWSAVHAVECLKNALNEPHLQDAMEIYRRSWRTTLGEYLRGPQQNLRYLLPLIYRNPVMTARLAEAVLEGKSIVR